MIDDLFRAVGEHPLEAVGAFTQLIVLGVATFAGWATYRQFVAYRLFELLKFTEDELVR